VGYREAGAEVINHVLNAIAIGLGLIRIEPMRREPHRHHAQTRKAEPNSAH